MGKNTVLYPEGNILHRKLRQALPIVTRAEGSFLFDKAGKKYFDASSGAFVCSVGHSHPHVVECLKEQLGKISYVNGTHFANEACEKLASRMVEHMPEGLDKVFFLSSGSEAIEAAVKFARQYWVSRGMHSKQKMISQFPSYHGNTCLALSTSGRPHYQKYFSSLMHSVIWIEAPQKYRFKGSFEEKGARHYLRELEEKIQHEGAENISCLLMEPMGGSSTGGVCPPPSYLEGVQRLCSKHDILVIADEVLVGAGRTGTFTVGQKEDFCPCIMVLAKGLNGGYVPLSALLTKQDLCDVIKAEDLGFMHAQTFINHPLGAAAANAVLDCFEQEKILEHVRSLESWVRDELQSIVDSSEVLGFIEGRGFLFGLEIVESKDKKEPFKKDKKAASKVQNILFDNGIVSWINSGHLEQGKGDLLLLAPPLNTRKDEWSEVFQVIRKSLPEIELKLKA